MVESEEVAMSLADKIFTCFKGVEKFSLKEVYAKYSDFG